MPFSYKPLWHTLLDKGITKEQLRAAVNLSPATIARMGKGKYVSLSVLDDICNYLQCPISEVIEHIPGEVKSRAKKK